jgi:hypothetical protein
MNGCAISSTNATPRRPRTGTWEAVPPAVCQPGVHHQAGGVDAIGYDARAGGASSQRIQDGLARHLLELHVDVAVSLQEASEPRGKGFCHRGSVAMPVSPCPKAARATCKDSTSASTRRA